MEYVSTTNQPQLNQAWRQTALFLAFFALSTVVLMIVGKFAIKETFDGDLATYQKITKLLYGGTIFLGLLVVVLRRLGLSVLSRRNPSATTAGVLKKLQALALVCAALGELIGLLGFVAFVITRDYQFCWRMGMVGLLVILYSFPRRWEWARAVAAAE